MTNIHHAEHIIYEAITGDGFSAPELRTRHAARLLADAGLLMPDGMSTQTETVGPSFPEGEEMPDLPEGTDVTRIVGPWEEA